jgi:hypothetical protein
MEFSGVTSSLYLPFIVVVKVLAQMHAGIFQCDLVIFLAVGTCIFHAKSIAQLELIFFSSSFIP